MNQGYMSYINRSNMKVGTQEVLTSFEWEIEFTHKPNAVFWPGDEILKVRMKEVRVPVETENEQLTIQLKGFTLHQSGLTNNTGNIGFNFQDFEDQSIVAFMEDWLTKANSRVTRRGVHKRDLYADINVYRLNSFRVPVKKWTCETCLPISGNPGDSFTSEKSALGNCDLNLSTEFYKIELLNL